MIMDSDEVMIVVILGDNDIKSEEQSTLTDDIEIKQEILDETEQASLVEELLQTAEKHGEHLNPEHFDFIKKMKEEPCNDEYVEDGMSNSDEEFVPNEIDTDDDGDTDYDDDDYIIIKKRKKKNKDKVHNRSKMLDPTECYSYVAKVREDNPYFDDDQLVAVLANIMKNTQPPPPPRDYYRVDGLNFQCIECSILTTSLPAAARHYQEYHGPRYLTCFACGVDFRRIIKPPNRLNNYQYELPLLGLKPPSHPYSKTNLYKHEKRCVAPDAVYVLKARAVMVGTKGRDRPFLHLVKKELKKPVKPPKKIYKCDECSAVFHSPSGLEAHTNLHRGERPYTCDECGAAYTAKSGLYRHRQKHANKRFICDICGKEFKVKGAMVYHLDTHLPQRKFPCPYAGCGRRFAQKMALNVHMNGRHEHLPPPCACQICPRRFTRMSLLKVHMRKEHGMTLMTRNMFFKKLPTLSDTELKQAKVIFNHDEPPKTDEFNQIVEPKKRSEMLRIQIHPADSFESEADIQKLVQELMNSKDSEKLEKEGGVIVIENGEVKYINESSEQRDEIII